MKKIVSLVMAVVMCLSLAVVGTASASAKSTSSVKARNKIINFAEKYYMKDLNYFLRKSKYNKTMKDCFF